MHPTPPPRKTRVKRSLTKRIVSAVFFPNVRRAGRMEKRMGMESTLMARMKDAKQRVPVLREIRQSQKLVKPRVRYMANFLVEKGFPDIELKKGDPSSRLSSVIREFVVDSTRPPTSDKRRAVHRPLSIPLETVSPITGKSPIIELRFNTLSHTLYMSVKWNSGPEETPWRTVEKGVFSQWRLAREHDVSYHFLKLSDRRLGEMVTLSNELNELDGMITAYNKNFKVRRAKK